MCRGRRKFLLASLALVFIPTLTWLYLSVGGFQGKKELILLLFNKCTFFLGKGCADKTSSFSKYSPTDRFFFDHIPGSDH